jgi:hypothetical protein
MRPVTINPRDPLSALREIERASHEGDLVEIAQNFTVDNPGFTQVFQINTTAPSVGNIANFIATFITLARKGGLNRTT